MTWPISSESQETQDHQEAFAVALKHFIDTTPEAVNGIIIWVDHPLIKGKLVFEIDGKLPLEEAYAERMRRERASA